MKPKSPYVPSAWELSLLKYFTETFIPKAWKWTARWAPNEKDNDPCFIISDSVGNDYCWIFPVFKKRKGFGRYTYRWEFEPMVCVCVYRGGRINPPEYDDVSLGVFRTFQEALFQLFAKESAEIWNDGLAFIADLSYANVDPE